MVPRKPKKIGAYAPPDPPLPFDPLEPYNPFYPERRRPIPKRPFETSM